MFAASAGLQKGANTSDIERVLVGFVGFVSWLLPALWAYALVFVCMPLLRFAARLVSNRRVRGRNAHRVAACREALAAAEAAGDAKATALASAAKALARGGIV